MRIGRRASAAATITVLALWLAGCVVNVVAAPEAGSTVASHDPAPPDTIAKDTVGEVTSSTTPSSSTVKPEGNGRLVIVGDSLTLGADRYGGLVERLERLGWEVTFDAMEGRTTPQGVQILTDLMAVDPDPEVVMVGLGTNDFDVPADFRPLVQSVVDLTAESRLIWMSIDWEGRSGLQGVLDDFERTGDVTQIDFGLVIAAHPEYVGYDGIHLTEEGYVARASTIVENVGPP